MEIANKKILVTGADGFIGSHLTEMLVKAGAKVRALSQYNSFNSWGWLENIDCLEEVEVVTGDIRDPHYCQHISREVDVIFHLAALIAIPYSYIAPDSYVATNVTGTLNICQAARDNKCERLIHTSTSEVYGTARYVPIDEKHPLQPQSPYSASKTGADCMALSFYNSFELPVVVARPFNTFGPRQSARAIIPTIISQIAQGAAELKLGDLSPTRDLNYVTDTCRGLIALAGCDECLGETVNIGSNYEVSMGQVVSEIRDLMGSEVEIATEEQRLRPAQSEVFRLWCDNTKLKRLTGFAPEYDLRQGLEKTIAWFSELVNLGNYKGHIYNV
ncbi:MAG: NAD-dependent 4,6-dehydratase LegB [Desulfonatronovibrio sp.]